MIIISEFLKTCLNIPEEKIECGTYDLLNKNDPQRYFFCSTYNYYNERHRTLASQFELERKFLCLPYTLCWHFIYHNFNGQLFNIQGLNIVDVLADFRHAENYPELLAALTTIYATFFDGGENYSVVIQGLKIPWNDRIMSKLAAFEYNCKSALRLPPNIEKLSISLFDAYPKDELKEMALGYFTGNLDMIQKWETEIDHEHCLLFCTTTHHMAPSLNGTACVGKSYFVTKLLNELKTIDKNAKILKVGNLGMYCGKDSNQVLAMENQYTMLDAGLNWYTSLMDRDPLNNLIWRIIMKLMNFVKTEEIIENFITLLQDFSPLFLSGMNRLPNVIIIDTNLVANRKRMFKRALGSDGSRGDFVRCKIPTYTPIQNMVYGTLAVICNWTLLNKAGTFDHQTNALSIMLKEKILHNIKFHRGHLPKEKIPEPHKIENYDNADVEDSFRGAKALNIFK